MRRRSWRGGTGFGGSRTLKSLGGKIFLVRGGGGGEDTCVFVGVFWVF